MLATRPPVSPRELAETAWRHIQADQLDLAAAAYEALRFFRPADARLLCNLSFLYERVGLLDEAEDRARFATRLAPHLPEAWNNLGIALRELHRCDEALAAFDRAVTEQPDFPLGRFNQGTTALLIGNYRRGWTGYEQRLRLAECRAKAPNLPRWEGEPLNGRPLVVYSDQGIGDALQFARFLPELRNCADGGLWFCISPELHRLFTRLPSVDRIVSEPEDCPANGVAIPLGSLPGLLNLDIEQLPWREQYITRPSKPLVAPIEFDDHRLKIGLVWQGNPQQGRDRQRSCPLRLLEPLAHVENVDWFSLQVNDAGRSQLHDVPDWRITDLAPYLHDFADTAAALLELDLLITVDTAVAHLAGAMGIPAWVLLCHTPDWRWGLDSSETAWYPSLRLFRQPARGNWESVVHAVRRVLRNLVPGTSSSRTLSGEQVKSVQDIGMSRTLRTISG